MNRRGQVAIFIIIGLLLASVITFLFLINKTPKTKGGSDLDNPESFIDNCVRQKAEKSIDEIMIHGGFPNSTDNVLYKGESVPYLCKNINFYKPCVVQHPLYLREVETEIKNEISNVIFQCFDSLEQRLQQKNYLIDAGQAYLGVEAKPEMIKFSVSKNFVISKDEYSKTYNNFDVFISSPLYELALIVQEIIAQETKWCHFSNDGFMLTYNDFDIRLDMLGDSTKIYTVKHKETDKKIMFAIRGCAIPLGF